MCDSRALNHSVRNVNFRRPSPPPSARRLRPERLWLAQRCTAGRRRSLGPHRPISRLFLHQGREHRRCSVNPVEQRDALSLSFPTSLCSPELTALLLVTCPGPWGLSLISLHSVPTASVLSTPLHIWNTGDPGEPSVCSTTQVGVGRRLGGNASPTLRGVMEAQGLGSFCKREGGGFLTQEVWAGGCFTQPRAHPEMCGHGHTSHSPGASRGSERPGVGPRPPGDVWT